MVKSDKIDSEIRKVAVAYHFFAHYRTPVIKELVDRGQYSYLFFGNTSDPNSSGIVSATFSKKIKFYKLPTWRIGGVFIFQSGLLRLALRKDIQAIIFLGNVKFLMTWAAAGLARLAGKRVLFWTHGWLREEFGMMGWLRKIFYRLANGLLLYGNRARQIGIQAGFAPEDLYVIFNSLDTKRQQKLRDKLEPDDFWEVRQSLFSTPDRPLLIGVGRLTHDKRFDLLIQAAWQLKESGRPVNVLVVGEGSEYDTLVDLSKEYELEVCFYGACYHEYTLAKLIAAANVFVVPGSIGLSAIHSLVYGTPIVTHDCQDNQKPEWEAIIPGLNGSLYTFGEVDELVKAIQYWLHDGLTPDEVRKACYSVVDQYYNPRFQRCEIERALANKPARGYPLPESLVLPENVTGGRNA